MPLTGPEDTSCRTGAATARRFSIPRHVSPLPFACLNLSFLGYGCPREAGMCASAYAQSGFNVPHEYETTLYNVSFHIKGGFVMHARGSAFQHYLH